MNVQFTDKIDSIFKSTLLLIKDHGFHGTPMSQIAKHADVAIGTIYHYFPSKDDLMIELFHYCRRELYAYIFKHVNQAMPYKEQFYNSPYHEVIRSVETEDGPYAQNAFSKFMQQGINQQYIKPLDEKVIGSAYIGAAVTYAKNVVYGKIEFSEKQLTDLIDIIWTGIKNND